MKKSIKITLFSFGAVVVPAVIVLCVLLAMEFRFSAEQATDPNVTVYGLTVNSTIEEYDVVFRKMGYVISVEERGEHRVFTAKRADITITFDETDGSGNAMLAIRANVTNREGIQY